MHHVTRIFTIRCKMIPKVEFHALKIKLLLSRAIVIMIFYIHICCKFNFDDLDLLPLTAGWHRQDFLISLANLVLV